MSSLSLSVYFHVAPNDSLVYHVWDKVIVVLLAFLAEEEGIVAPVSWLLRVVDMT